MNWRQVADQVPEFRGLRLSDIANMLVSGTVPEANFDVAVKAVASGYLQLVTPLKDAA